MCGGISMWKEAHIKRAENILVICTPEYYQDYERALMEGRSSRIEVDRRLLHAIHYSTENDRLIPVLLDEYKNTRNCIPSFVQASPLHFWPSKKKDLIYCLKRMAKYQLPEITEKRELTPIVIQIPRRREIPSQPQMSSCDRKTHTQSHDRKSHDKKGGKSVTKTRTKEPSKTPHAQSHDKNSIKLFGLSLPGLRKRQKSQK